MKITDLKYLLAYLTPLAVWISLYFAGIWSWFGLFFAFVIGPVMDWLLPNFTENHSKENELARKSNSFFDILLYLNVPMLYGLLIFFFYLFSLGGLTNWEILGLTASMGVVAGSVGINVAHELGHRKGWFDQFMSRALLLVPLYMHFNIEHNKGHHTWVATPNDPASAVKNQSFYNFWWQSVKGGYHSAWKIQLKELEKDNQSFWSINNNMLLFQVTQLVYLSVVGIILGPVGVVLAIMVSIGGFTQLELVNYIEHYGLRRKLKENNRYERVQPHHSWNSNHEFGRILLYELTRHSDHHYKASRKFQILRHFDESPQLPYGYPGSMILALFPPLWFKKINQILEAQGAHYQQA